MISNIILSDSLQRKIFYSSKNVIMSITSRIINFSFNVNSPVGGGEGVVAGEGWDWEVTFECSRARHQFALTELIYYLEYFCILKGSCNNCKPDSV